MEFIPHTKRKRTQTFDSLPVVLFHAILEFLNKTDLIYLKFNSFNKRCHSSLVNRSKLELYQGFGMAWPSSRELTLPILQWIYANNPLEGSGSIARLWTWRPLEICSNAAYYGHFEILKWMFEKEKEEFLQHGEYVCSNAARGGHLEILKWAKEKECCWDEQTCAGAAKYGNLNILKWARLKRCPWNSTTYFEAAKHGNLEIFKWAILQKCPWNSEPSLTASVAAENGHLEILKCMVSLKLVNLSGYQATRLRNLAKDAGHTGIVNWFFEAEKMFFSSEKVE